MQKIRAKYKFNHQYDNEGIKYILWECAHADSSCCLQNDLGCDTQYGTSNSVTSTIFHLQNLMIGSNIDNYSRCAAKPRTYGAPYVATYTAPYDTNSSIKQPACQKFKKKLKHCNQRPLKSNNKRKSRHGRKDKKIPQPTPGLLRAHWTSGLQTDVLGYELGYKVYEPYNVIFYHRAVGAR